METRLEVLEPALAEKIKQAEPSKRREYALKFAVYALGQTTIKNELLERVVHDLANGQLGKALNQRKAIADLLEELEETQLILRKQADSGQTALENYVAVFKYVRAVNAVFYALDPDSYIATTESAYEAYTITNDLDAINHILA